MGEPPPVRACAVEMPIRVNGYDIDFQGVVHNLVYVRWFEDLRFRLIDEFLPLQEQMAAGFAPMLMSTLAEYKRPLRMHDHPVGRLWLADATRARWTVEIEIALGDAVVATGVQKGVFVDLKSLRPVRVPTVFTAAIDHARAAAVKSG